MNEDKKLIVTITQGGKPLYATQCKFLIGTTLLDDIGNANALMLGSCNKIDIAATVASLYEILADIEKKNGPEFKALVDLARKTGRRVVE